MSSSSSSTNVVGVHYKVGRKLGEGSFGIIYEGTLLQDEKYNDFKLIGFFFCIRNQSIK